MTPLDRLEALQKTLDTPTRQEFVSAFKNVVDYVKGMDARLTGDFELLASTVRGIGEGVKTAVIQRTTKTLSDLRATVDEKLNAVVKDLSDKLDARFTRLEEEQRVNLNYIRDKADSLQNGQDGRTPTTEELVALIKPLIPEPIPGPKGEPGVSRRQIGWGAHPLTIHNASGVVDKTTRDIKFTGATVSRSSDGVTTVAISASGITELASTETPNGSTTVFTFSGASAQPSYIVSDNVWLKATTKSGVVNWTWNSGTKQATLIIPPNEDIYAIV